MTQILQLRAASDAIALECVGVVGDAYLDPEGLIRSAMGRNSHVALDRVGRHLRGFLFFSIDDEILLRGRRHRIPYLGLIAVHPEHRNRGVASKLLERFRAYVRLNIGNATHTWAITATPAFYLACSSVFGTVYPAEDGTAPVAMVETAFALRSQAGSYLESGDQSHPFILRSARPQRFSKQEAARALGVARHRAFRTFEELGILESQGDRLLVIACLRQT